MIFRHLSALLTRSLAFLLAVVAIPAQAAPSYPEIVGVRSGLTASSTSHVVGLPDGIEAGDLLIMILGFAQNTTAITTPSGWNALANSGAVGRAGLYYRVATGGETTVTVMVTGAANGAYTVYRILAGTYKGVPVASMTDITSGNPNPPSLTPNGGASGAYLWLAGSGGSGMSSTPSNPFFEPAGYGNGIRVHSASGSATARALVYSFRRVLTAANQDPGGFQEQTATSTSHRAFTIAIEGADRLVWDPVAPIAPSPHGNLAEVTVRRQLAHGDALITGSTTIQLSSTGGGEFYGSMTGGSPLTEVTITNGNSHATVYYSAPVNGTHTITATAPGFRTATTTVPVTLSPLELNSPPDISTTSDRAAYTIKRNTPLDDPLTVNLSVDPPVGYFYNAASGGSVITSVVLDAMDDTASFWFDAVVPQVYTVTASAAGLPDAIDEIEVRTGTIYTNSRITVDKTSILADNADTVTITVTLYDEDNNRIYTSMGEVNLITAPFNAGFLSDVTDHGDGTYTATFTGVVASEVLITGALGPCPLTDTAVVTIEGLPVYNANNEQAFALSSPQLVSGTYGEAGSLYSLPGALSVNGVPIEIRFSIDARHNTGPGTAMGDGANTSGSEGFRLDNDASNSPRFQPQIGSASSAGSYMDFTFRFFVDGEPISLSGFYVTAVDLDGASSPTNTEYLEIGGFSSYEVDNATQLTISAGEREGTTRFLGGNNQSGIPFTNTHAVIINYQDPVSVLPLRLGLTGDPSENRREFSIQFGLRLGNFSNPVEPPLVTGPSHPTGSGASFKIVAEGNTLVHQFTAVSESPVIWSLSGGADQSDFEIHPDTGVLSFKVAPYYDTPHDADLDNEYHVTVRATDPAKPAGKNVADQKVVITVVKLSSVTVIAHPKTKYAGDPDPEFTYDYTVSYTAGPCVPPPYFTGSLSREPGESNGSYRITQGTLAAAGYQIVFLHDDLHITDFWVSSPTVNEKSPYAIFTVKGYPGWQVTGELEETGQGPGHASADISNADYGTNMQDDVSLQYYDTATSQWAPFNGAVTLPDVGGVGQLLVRTTIVDDDDYEGPETFLLRITNQDDVEAVGIATIVDDNSGDVFVGGNNTGIPDESTEDDYPNPLDDDRGLVVSNLTVSESSPYAIFTITSDAPNPADGAGQIVLALEANVIDRGVGYAILSDDVREGETPDVSHQIQYFDPSSNQWIDYAPFIHLRLDSSGKLLVRVPVGEFNDDVFEGPEIFSLSALNLNNTRYGGIATIVDDGTGKVFLSTNVSGVPSNTNSPSYSGPMPDDDRALTVTGNTFNEGSPFAVFKVEGDAGQLIKLELGETGSGTGHAKIGVDFGDNSEIQVNNGSGWVNYSSFTNGWVPASAGGILLVRTPIDPDYNDNLFEELESFLLKAINTGGTVYTGTGYIADDGTGEIFLPGNNTATPNVDTDPGYPAELDDDSDAFTAEVNDLSVNEGSPYAVFTIEGTPDGSVKLALQDGTATRPDDYGATFQVFNGSNWVDYTPGNTVDLDGDGKLLVRVSIGNDNDFEGPETFTLRVTDAGDNLLASGTATIRDDGAGSIFLATNSTGTPDYVDDPGAGNYGGTRLDDDRALKVSDLSVNEASPYAVLTVMSDLADPADAEGQIVQLSLAITGTGSGHAAMEGDPDLSPDFAGVVQYYDAGLAQWTDYDSSNPPALDADGKLLVRVSIGAFNDMDFEQPETFHLVATNGGGTDFTTTVTIVDDGTGNIFLPTNTTGTPDYVDDPGAGNYGGTRLDDDRELTVSSPTVNEASPYVVFTVTSSLTNPADAAGQLVTIKLDTTGVGAGHATWAEPEADIGSDLQYYDTVSSTWMDYTLGDLVPLSAAGSLLVRVAVVQDNLPEGLETFELTVTNLGGKEFSGTGGIRDDGAGDYYDGGNDDGNPDVPPGPLDDDRPIANLAGSALNFGGTSYGESTLADVAGLYAESLTLEVWVRRDTPVGGGDTETILAKGDDWGLRLVGDKLEFFTSGLSNVVLQAEHGSGLLDDEFHHIAAVYDAGTGSKKIYIDGVQVAEVDNVTGTLADTSSRFRIAANAVVPDPLDDPALGELWNGRMDEVRVWNVVRDAGQLEATKDTILYGYEFGLVHYWRLDEGTGNLSRDLVASDPAVNVLVLTGSPQWFKPEGAVERLRSLSGMDLEIQLAGYDGLGTPVVAYVTSLPAQGTLYQMLPNGDKSEPITQDQLAAGTGAGAAPGEVRVEDPLGRLIYVAPDARVTNEHIELYGSVAPGFTTFEYLVKSNGVSSLPEEVTIDLETVNLVAGIGLRLDRNLQQYVRTENLRSGFVDNSVTIEIWFRAEGPGVLVQEQGQPNIDTGWHNSQIEVVDIDGTQAKVRVRVWNIPEATASQLTEGLTLGVINYNEWHHAAVRYNHVSRRMDGALDGVPSSTHAYGDRQTPWETIVIDQWNQASRSGVYYSFGARTRQHLGSGAPTPSTHFNNCFTGVIDEVRIWNEAIPDDRLAKDRTRFLEGDDAKLVALYRFDEPTGNIVAEVTNPARNATIFNGAQRESSAANLNYAESSWSEEALVELPGYLNKNFTATVTRMPLFGSVYQVNPDGSRGARITNVPTVVTDSNHRVIVVPAVGSRFDSIEYQLSDGDNTFGTRRMRFLFQRDNSAPVIAPTATLTGAVEDMPFVITYDALAAALGATDADGTDPVFRLEKLQTGRLLLCNDEGEEEEAIPYITTLDKVNNTKWVWYPQLNVNRDIHGGPLAAFNVVATDGRDFSDVSRVSIDIDPRQDDIMGIFPGRSLKLNGNGFVYTPNLRSLFRTDSVTIEVFFRADGPGVLVSERATANRQGWSNSQLEVVTIAPGVGEVRAAVWQLGGPTGISLGTITYGTWNHAVVRYDESTLTLDGFLNGSAALDPVIGQARTTPWLGGNNALYYGFGLADARHLGSGAAFNGHLREIRIWRVALPTGMILSSYPDQDNLTGDEPNLAVWYRFTQTSGTTIVDEGPHRTGGLFGPVPGLPNLNATVNGGASWADNVPTTSLGEPIKIRLYGLNIDVPQAVGFLITELPPQGLLYQVDAFGNPLSVPIDTAPRDVSNPDGYVIYVPNGSTGYDTEFKYAALDANNSARESSYVTVPVRVVETPEFVLLLEGGVAAVEAPPRSIHDIVRIGSTQTVYGTHPIFRTGIISEGDGSGDPEASKLRLRIEFSIDRAYGFVVEYSDDLVEWHSVIDLHLYDVADSARIGALAEVDAGTDRRFIRVRLVD